MKRTIAFALLALVCLFEGMGSDDINRGAYIPYYRLQFLSGAENTLGRPGWSPSPRPWEGQFLADTTRELPSSWQDASWETRLPAVYNTFYLHIPLDEDFLSGKTPNPRHLAYLRSFISPNPIQIQLSLIGGSRDFLPLIADEPFIQRLADLCGEQGFDGINLDWEFPATPKAHEKAGLSELARKLKEVLPEKALLTAAVSRWRLPDQDFFPHLDGVNLMAYDGFGRHATFLTAQADTENLLTRMNLDPAKVSLGLPFYGRKFRGDDPEYWSGTLDYKSIVERFSPLPEDNEAGGYFFNGPKTIEEKTLWAKKRGMEGIFVWEPFHDARGERSLSVAIQQALTASKQEDDGPAVATTESQPSS
ncbi:MAG: glycoside hydrolase family 18 protein [Spirochaetales bacterium]|nr:glycoside hydrolase family 18 protein [Spirochaetales bacterium]